MGRLSEYDEIEQAVLVPKSKEINYSYGPPEWRPQDGKYVAAWVFSPAIKQMAG